MDVLILTHGTRGDLQPFVALGRALTSAGHRVRLGAPAASASLVRSYGLQFVPLADGPNELADDGVMREAFETNYQGLRGKQLAMQLARMYRPMMDAVLMDMANAASGGADVLVHHIILPGQELGEWLGVPAVPVCMQPFWTPTRAFPNPMHDIRLPHVANRLTYLTTKLWYQILAGHTARWRSEQLGLPRRRGHRDVLRRPDGGPATLLQAFSTHLLEAHPTDTPPWVHTTGFWFHRSPHRWEPLRHVREFVEAGDPPVYIGFGSMAGMDPDQTSRVIGDAVHMLGVRAVVAEGWGGLRSSAASDDILHVEQIPHEWLFSRVAAVVHHGGSGTTAAALAAGRPQVVCPFVGDQPYYARRLHALGVAPAPLPQRDLTTLSISLALEDALTEPARAAAAADLSQLVRAEGGTDQAVKVLEDTVDHAE